jgi:ABC-2 type transport system permease protein
VTALRIFAAGWWMNMKQLSQSPLFVFTSLIEPLIMATIAFYTAKSGGKPEALFYLAIGAGVMGIWSSTLFGSGGVISWQRWEGTLELLVASPPPLIVIVVPLTIATASIGIYSLAATLLWGRLLFGIPFHLAHPWLFALALPVGVVAMGLLGLLIAATFVLYREANALSNMLEFPIALVTGLLFSTALLPGWALPIGWALAPTWAVRAIRDAALGGGGAALPIAMCIVLGATYVVAAMWFLNVMEIRAREKATLSLA